MCVCPIASLAQASDEQRPPRSRECRSGLSFLILPLGGMPARKPEPLYGWCATRHSPLKAAQSGYVDSSGKRYCKTCFRDLCPEFYAAKQARRTGVCRLCKEARVLLQGVCRPCIRARACSVCQELMEGPETPSLLCTRPIPASCRTCYNEPSSIAGVCVR